MLGKELVISLLLKVVLPKGLEWIKSYEQEKHAELVQAVKDVIPGERFDALAEELTEDVIKHALKIAEGYLSELQKEHVE